ncbi:MULTISPECIES: zinc-binding dehydrogenase [Prauserella salsuginis group]|uniref:Zinc-binding dehydrogenase n=1 Tax=Prauserella salsuginis TaxID=387889 RepID=A0ABW6G9V8_9PSEU|nr:MULTISPECIES: zinc-binding dehydrogenase [Prauserella salsuginis group]MCR3721406.1 NADPH2:quinone reductase [Prauserella flava]MCR3732396.1 NADPH2:quinone reductase [Prauserella salsuginis]
MRVVWWTKPGGPEVLQPGEADLPAPGRGEVLIDVEYAGITFVETQLRAGLGPFAWEPPLIPGNGVGGVVSRIGGAVDPALVGARVVSGLSGSGGYAEHAVVAADRLLPVPDGVSMSDAVAVLADGRTAMLLHRGADPRQGERVLVEAAAGGVGGLLAQLAANAGAVVVAAAGGQRKTRLAREAGSSHAVDYLDPQWTDQLRERIGGVDVVYDGVGGDIGRAAFGLLAPGGRMLVHGMASGVMTDIPAEEAEARGVTVTGGLDVTPETLHECARDALAEVAAGRLRPRIGAIHPLERAADAHAAIDARTVIGKTLLAVNP